MISDYILRFQTYEIPGTHRITVNCPFVISLGTDRYSNALAPDSAFYLAYSSGGRVPYPHYLLPSCAWNYVSAMGFTDADLSDLELPAGNYYLTVPSTASPSAPFYFYYLEKKK